AGSDDLVRGIKARARLGAGEPANGDDAVALCGEVGAVAGEPGPIDDAAAADQDIEHETYSLSHLQDYLITASSIANDTYSMPIACPSAFAFSWKSPAAGTSMPALASSTSSTRKPAWRRSRAAKKQQMFVAMPQTTTLVSPLALYRAGRPGCCAVTA